MAIEIRMPESQRDQGMLAVAILSFLAIGAYWYFMYNPKSLELTTLRGRVDTLVIRNNTIRADIARGAATRLKEEAEEYGRLLQVFRQLVPVANEVPTLVDQISGAARQTGLDLGNIDPLGVIPGEIFDTHRYRMTVTGPYHRLAQFLDNVGSLTRIVAPMNLTLNPSSRSVKVGPAELALDASFEIQTFVAKVPLPAPGAPPAGGAP
jgi:type IV pilus assembly protein PilO